MHVDWYRSLRRLRRDSHLCVGRSVLAWSGERTPRRSGPATPDAPGAQDAPHAANGEENAGMGESPADDPDVERRLEIVSDLRSDLRSVSF